MRQFLGTKVSTILIQMIGNLVYSSVALVASVAALVASVVASVAVSVVALVVASVAVVVASVAVVVVAVVFVEDAVGVDAVDNISFPSDNKMICQRERLMPLQELLQGLFL